MKNNICKTFILSAASLTLATTASAAWLGTGGSATSYYGGNLFDFTNDSGTALSLTGQLKFDAMGSGGTSNYAVYTKAGKLDWLTSNYTDHTEWTLWSATSTVTNAAGTLSTIDLGSSILLDAGESVSIAFFYIDGDGGYVGYRSGAGTFSDGAATITTGIAKGARGGTVAEPDLLFGVDTFKPRTWVGEVGYEPVPEPMTMVTLAGAGLLALRRKRKSAK